MEKNNFNFYTIGVYGKTEEEYFSTIQSFKIDCFIDIRRRRGVRGKKYSFVNSNKLQEILKNNNIEYLYERDLAPSSSIRSVQKAIDKNLKIKKTEREELSKDFINLYTDQILNKFNFENLFSKLRSMKKKNIVFFCVEKNAIACHRSIIAKKLENTYNFSITNL